MHNKIIVILGPTASGKTDISIKLAKKFNGEIVSADSRQVYKALNIGSGKVTKKEMKGVPHHLLDVASPKRKFTVAQFQKLALKKIQQIQKRGDIPFLVGGSGFYIQSVVDGLIIPEVKPNWKLREKLERKSKAELFLMLKKLDSKRAESIDKNNPRRLIRAIEIVMATGKPIPKIRRRQTSPDFDILQIGIKKSPSELKKLIKKRLDKRLRIGMIVEVENLHKNGLSWKRLEELGLEYRYVAQYLQKKPSFDTTQDLSAYQEMIDKIQIESEHFTKRQMTWFKRDKKIHWVNTSVSLSAGQKKAEGLIKNFLK